VRWQNLARARFFLLIAAVALGVAACGQTAPAPAADEDTPQLTVDEILALEDDPQTQAGAANDQASGQSEQSAQQDEAGPAPLQALIYVQPRQVRQGSAFLVVVDSAEAGAASVAFAGEFFSFVREGDRLFTILPVAADAVTGTQPFIVSVADAEGRPALTEEVQIEISPADWPIEVVEIDDANSRLLDPAVVAEDLAVRAGVQRAKTPERLWSGFFRQPAAGVITSTFGVLRSYNFAEPVEFHTGMDHAGSLGELVVAPNDGIVAWVGETERRGRGLILDHGGGVFTTFWHLSSVGPAPGDPIARGGVLGRIGSTGLSTGPHLHWEVVVHGVPVDPIQWIRQTEVPDPKAVFDPTTAVNAGSQVAIDGLEANATDEPTSSTPGAPSSE
jgi:murein DD-endopeptidase MepM/ murein hydrolase activator NlpD